MAQKKLKIVWKDGFDADLFLYENPLAEFYYKCIKNLQHLELYFGPRENLYHPLLSDRAGCEQELINHFKKFDVVVEQEKLNNQQYLNYLHDIYFNNCKSKSDAGYYNQWMLTHDMIHVMELHNHQSYPATVKFLKFNYRDMAGLLYQPFNPEYLKYANYSASAGTVYLSEQELGKNPKIYYENGEPGDIDRICQQVKPWVNIIPSAVLSLGGQEENKNFDEENKDFIEWFAPYREAWTHYYNIPNWQPQDIFAKVHIGQVEHLDEFIKRAQQNNCPIKIIL